MKVVVLVTYLLTTHGMVEGRVCAFGLAARPDGAIWDVCTQFQLQQTVAERAPPGYLGQGFACELHDRWPTSGYCFSGKDG